MNITFAVTDLSPNATGTGALGTVSVTLGAPTTDVLLLAHGVSTPPAGTPIGTLIFQKGA